MKKAQGKQILGNTAYTMGGMLLMNGVLQLAVYPLLNAQMGQEELGSVLYIMGLVSILCPSVGQALNTSRLVVRRTCQVNNGDYDRLLILFAGIGGIIAILGSGSSLRGWVTVPLTLLLILTTAFRYYGDVEYRLNLNYQRYFIYYALISAGYLLGYGLYRLTGNWFLIFLVGEGAALVYVGITGSVFKNFWKKSQYFSTACVRGFFLTLSYLITNTTLNMDRLALKHMVGNEAVTQYYVVSLIGKTMVLLVAPINTIVISYLTRRERTLNKKEFSLAAGAGFLVSFLFFLCCQIGTPLFVKIFYPDLYTSVRPLMTVVNLTQVLALYSAFLFILVLTFTNETWQLILQAAHLVIMAVLVVIFTLKDGIVGFSYGALLANAIRVAAVIILGFGKIRR
ncbi:MAG: lipopolysaccharide biosynthesis protein [Ruminococcus sp.]